MDHSPLSHSIAAMVRRESVQAHLELDRRQEQLQQLLDYNQTHDLDPRLTEGFYRCHRSFVVHLAYVSGIQKYRFLLRGGGEVPIAMRHYQEAQERWLAYLK